MNNAGIDFGTFSYDALLKLFIAIAAGILLSGVIWLALIVRATKDQASTIQQGSASHDNDQ